MFHCCWHQTNEMQHFPEEPVKLDTPWCNAEVGISERGTPLHTHTNTLSHTHTHTVAVSLTRLFPLLAAALRPCVQHHLLDHLQLLGKSREMKICALLRHGGKIWIDNNKGWSLKHILKAKMLDFKCFG